MLSMLLCQCFSGSMLIVTSYSNTVPQQRQCLSVLFSSHNSNDFVKQRFNQPINGVCRKNLNCKRLPISSAVNNALRGSAQSFCFASESQSLQKRTCNETCNVLLAYRMLQCIRINTPHGVVLRNGQQSFQSGSNELQQMKNHIITNGKHQL